MTRAPVFSAIKSARAGRAFSSMEVAQVDDLLDRLGIPRDDAPAARLGALSERYESGGRGPGTVSSGSGDPGGVSYGLYQLSSKAGTATSFLAAEGKPWAAELGNAPGSAQFSAAWKAIAAREPERFAAAQHAFIERTHYRPCVDAVLKATGVNVDARAQAVRDTVWSCAVQHGRAAQIVADGVRKAGAAATDAQLVNAIFDARVAYVKGVAANTGADSASTFRAILENRYPDERARALAMLA